MSATKILTTDIEKRQEKSVFFRRPEYQNFNQNTRKTPEYACSAWVEPLLDRPWNRRASLIVDAAIATSEASHAELAAQLLGVGRE